MPNFSLIFFKVYLLTEFKYKEEKKSLEFVNKNSNNINTKGEKATFEKICSFVKQMVFICTICDTNGKRKLLTIGIAIHDHIVILPFTNYIILYQNY